MTCRLERGAAGKGQHPPDDHGRRFVARIFREFPDLTAADVAACLDYARDLADFEASAA